MITQIRMKAGDTLTEAERLYKKERQKKVVINLKLSDASRWSAYAALHKQPLATMIRKAVEKEIAETEDSFNQSIEEILHYQELLKCEL